MKGNFTSSVRLAIVITFEFKFTLFGTVIDRLACSKRSDSGELSFFRAPFYFAPLLTI